MRTSYDRGNSSRKKVAGVSKPPVDFEEPVMSSPQEEPEEFSVHNMIVSGYAEVKDALEAKKAQNDLMGVMSGYSEPVQQGNQGSKNPGKKPKKQPKEKPVKRSKRGLIFGIVGAVVAAIVIVAVLMGQGIIPMPSFGETEPTTEPTVPYEPQLEIIAGDIAKLYTSDEKVDVLEELTSADLEEYYARLSEAANNGEDTAELVAELTTISDYLYDRSRLTIFENADYDLAPDSFSNDVLKVKASADNYSVLSLKNAVYARADALMAMREEYLRIKSTLLGVSDLLAFDEATYTEAIKAITHTPNAEELTLLLTKVSADSAVVKAEAAIENAEDKTAAEEALANAKIAQEEATKAWLIFTCEWVEEPTVEATEDTTPEEG